MSVRRPALMLGMASAILAFMALHALVYFIEATDTPGKGPIWLPPPTSLTMLVGVALVAALFGYLVYRYNRNAFPDPQWKPQIVFAVTLAVLAGGGLFIGAKVEDHEFLEALSADDSNSNYLLSEGRHACGWLEDQHWGPPVGFDRGGEVDGTAAEFAMKHKMRVIDSTSVLYEKYMKTDGAPNDGRVVLAAWYRMCPLQQFVHRPVGGNSSSD